MEKKENNSLKKFMTRDIPESIDSQILELLKKPADKTKFESDGNSIRVQKIIGNDIMNIEIKQYPNGHEVKKSTFNNSGNKSELEQTIKQMSKEGMKNKDIAEILDIHPSYVSKLNRK